MDSLHENAAATKTVVSTATKTVVSLAFPFDRGCYRHELLARSGRVCLVERTGGSVHYEVVVLRIAAPRLLPDGTPRLAEERYPPTAAWGREGWTYTTLAAARVVFEALMGDRLATLSRARDEAARLERVNKSRWSRGESDLSCIDGSAVELPGAPPALEETDAS